MYVTWAPVSQPWGVVPLPFQLVAFEREYWP